MENMEQVLGNVIACILSDIDTNKDKPLREVLDSNLRSYIRDWCNWSNLIDDIEAAIGEHDPDFQPEQEDVIKAGNAYLDVMYFLK